MSDRKKWEYKILGLDELMKYAPWNEKKMREANNGIRWKTAFDNLGKQGWELVESGRQLHGHPDLTVYVFKRELKK